MRFEFLSQAERERIASAIFRLLEEVGVRVTQPEAVELLEAAGAHVEGERVRIPGDLLERALHSAPEGISIYTRHGDLAMRLADRNAYFGGITDAPEILDPFTGERRPCTEEDVRANVRLIDALPEMYFTTTAGLVSDRPAEVGALVSMAHCLIGTPKPVVTAPVATEVVVASHEMAAIAVSGAEVLRDHPLLIVYAEPVSPLVHSDEGLEKLLYCAEHRIPLVYTGYAAQGGTAPMSTAGNVVQLSAESLSGLVIHQLKQPGAPFIFGGMPTVMDMQSTIFSYGAPEFQIGNTLMTEMAHHFSLPNFGTAGSTDSQVFDGQAIAEATSSCMLAYQVGGHLVHDVGMLGNATAMSPEMIVATHEILEMIGPMLSGVPLSDEMLALDVIQEVGPRGEYVTHPHTYDHFGDIWYPELFFRGGAEAWEASDQRTFQEVVTERTRELIKTYESDALPDEMADEIISIVSQAEEEWCS